MAVSIAAAVGAVAGVVALVVVAVGGILVLMAFAEGFKH
ncbi:hypothetical protein LNAOJCKE_3001 [Methylorubrum aminovorans]|uniref:Uncharacterized protein n=1 Tax=Methylorubrum aminovorans TaxID=269069 RepID=A0ABQ4UER6_9HYPH|nr:hypothetical protein LNAOJCKE_3001 [Methylorubrum aminovorans]